MTETLFGYVSTYGLPVIAISAFLSCLAVPIPTFAVMLAGGAFAASGDLVLWQVLACAYVAALLGDQSGFQIGRWGGPAVIFAPLGPWVNLVAGAAGMARLRFSAWDAAGEAIWVAGYVLLGFLFGSRLPELADLVGDWAGLVSSAGVTLVLGVILARGAILHQRRHRTPGTT